VVIIAALPSPTIGRNPAKRPTKERKLSGGQSKTGVNGLPQKQSKKSKKQLIIKIEKEEQ
jgi:hypothetical protein